MDNSGGGPMEYEIERYELRSVGPLTEEHLRPVKLLLSFGRKGDPQHPAIRVEFAIPAPDASSYSEIEFAALTEARLLCAAAHKALTGTDLAGLKAVGQDIS
jgi:hypothetical protein